MLRASWPLISLSIVPGARSRLERPAFPPSSLRLWRHDRSLVLSPKNLTIKVPFIEEAVPQVVLDESHSAEQGSDSQVRQEHETPEDGPDKFVASVSAGFRFPPFPLAVAEQPVSTVSTEPEPDTDTNIFEAKSPEYRVYERIPQPSADILSQVARSLPALLPEPDVNFDSIFEDKSHHDYTGISTLSSPPLTSTQSLEILVAEKKYDEALRVLDELLEVGTEIPFSFLYETAALAALKVTARTVPEMDHQIQTFRKWFSLIPRADQSRPHTFHRLVDRIMSSPLDSLRLIMEFGLVAAEKGFTSSTLHRVTSVVSMYGNPDVAIQYIDELRRRNRIFLEQSLKGTGVDDLDRKFHAGVVGTAVRTLASAGRLEHAVRLIPDPRKTIFHLTPYTYNFLLRKLKSTQDSRYLPHIDFIAQHKSETRYRSTGLRRMPSIKLAMSIRCLAKVGEFDLAAGLLPNLKKAELGLVTQTLDFFQVRLRDSGDTHQAHFDLISEVRQDMEPERVLVLPVPSACTTDDSESSLVRPIRDGQDVEYGPAIEALTRAWCLDEALALVPSYHRNNVRHVTRLYNLLLWKLVSSCNDKYDSALEWITQIRDNTLKLGKRAEALKRPSGDPLATQDERDVRLVEKEEETHSSSETEVIRRWEDFAENVFLSSSMSSKAPRPMEQDQDLATALRALKNGFRALSPSQRPHPLIVVHFTERYLSSGRTRAIPLLRNSVLRSTVGSSSYILAEMLFHARRRNPDLVIRTFVTHFYVVGVPRDELLLRMDAMETPESPDIWAARPGVKLYPDAVHAAVVWRALLEVNKDERALEGLYSKLLKFADLNSTSTSVLHPSVPYLYPPPAWKTGVAASAFTPFVRRMCYAFGAERGALVLKDMFKIGIMPTIHQLTEIAMEYSRTGDVTRTFSLLDQMELAAKDWDKKNEPIDNETVRRRAQQHDLIPRVDRVFYIAIIRGFLRSDKISAAREVERRMFQRYGYVPGDSQYLDDLYTDLQTAERANNLPSRLPLSSVVHNTSSKGPV